MSPQSSSAPGASQPSFPARSPFVEEPALSDPVDPTEPQPTEPQPVESFVSHREQTRELQPNHAAEVEAFEQKVSSLHHRRHHRSWLKRYGWILAMLGVTGVLTLGFVNRQSRQREAAAPETEAATVNPLSVRTATAEISTLREFMSGGGLVQATQFRNLSFDTAGEVTFIASGPDGDRLQVGDRVRQGQLLATIDDRNLQADLQRARATVVEAQEQVAAQQAQIAAEQAQVAQAQSQKAQTQSQVQEARAQVARSRSALELAQSELARYEQLFREGVITESNLEQRRNTLADERASLAAAEARVVSAQGQVNAAEAQIQSAQAQVRAAQDQLSATQARVDTAQAGVTQAEVALEDTNLYAPFDGVVSFINLRLGERFVPQGGTAQLDQNDATVASSVPIVIVDPTQLEASLALPAGSGDRIQIGQAAALIEGQNITAASLDLEGMASLDNVSLVDLAEASGVVTGVTPSVNPTLRTRETIVEITQGAENLQHGDRVTAFVAVTTVEDAVTVPPDAVVLRDRTPYVFVVDSDGMNSDGANGNGTNGSTVEQRPVRLGISGLNEQQILSGVQPGEQVVTEGQTRLVDGTPIRVVGESLMAP